MLRERLHLSLPPLRRWARWTLLSSVCLYTTACSGPEQASTSELEAGFESPPKASKPLVWWHWMNGNVTKEGIEKDLQWMHSVGIGGVQNFDANLNTPQVVDERITYMTPAWQELFNFALDKAAQYEFEFGIATSPGWSETGGPWVAPKDGMKKLVWSETTVNANNPTPVRLPAPPSTTGPFLDMPLQPEAFGGAAKAQDQYPSYYGDIAVLAYPLATPDSIPVARVTDAAGKTIDASVLMDGSYAKPLTLPYEGDEPYWLEFEFPQAESVRAAAVSMPPVSMFMPSQLHPELQASADGITFTPVADFELNSSPRYTVAFPAVKAKAFRLVFNTAKSTGFNLPSSSAPGAVDPLAGLAAMFGGQGKKVDITEVAFFQQARVHRAEEKAGFALNEDYYTLNQSRLVAGIDKSQVLDITQYLADDGQLNWQPKAGQWKIIRLGYSLTGKENHPANPEATGLEVDKYDAEAVRSYINTYLDKYLAAVGDTKMGTEGIQAALNDSIEVGPSNWTPSMAAEFKRRRGYELASWLPALTGVVINNATDTDAFLYDYRKTLAELLAENHYGVITEALHQRGLKHYSEALENGRPTLGDGIAMRKSADIPMAAMWSFDTENNVGPKPQYWSDIREAASVAHIYGQNLVAAESLTSAMSPWAFAPRDLQPMIDMEFALGVNRPIIHTSVHQPLTEKAPGLSLFIFGQYFNRLETWADYAQPWVSYITRNSYLLRQGHFAADVAYFYGEEAPLTALYNDQPPDDVPLNNGFDYVNADVIIHELQLDGSELITNGGARYKTLFLGGSSQTMTLPVLEKLAALVRGGGQVIGRQPMGSPSLEDDPEAFQKLADALWSGDTGKGRIIDSNDVEAGLVQLGIAPDFANTRPHADTTVMYVHRTLPDGEIYFYTNRKNRVEDLELSFRVTGKQPMHWDADSGRITPVTYRIVEGSTIIPRKLEPYESGYIVFTEKTKLTQLAVPAATEKTLATLPKAWQVSFQSGRGAPKELQTLPLGDWSRSAQEGIKYFSGTAIYQSNLQVEKDWLQGSDTLVLDLGDVGDIAEVLINGQSAGIAWKPPYRVDVREQLQPGNNDITIKVANLWVNRLIGDQQPDVEEKITFTTIDTYHPDAPLRPSGLMGPVTLQVIQP
ncbi:glycosyl hydrolase [Halioxenophilus sp. WMMB6]|uniref:glycosyl hydrolase n=1 Tax=Halioxenophilus sp. WMMB6 TaxID=3073815 RepID=UPI00295F0A54|nr:glycosyl hydrolase [Halioxenophilus sp. WMMB6]